MTFQFVSLSVCVSLGLLLSVNAGPIHAQQIDQCSSENLWPIAGMEGVEETGCIVGDASDLGGYVQLDLSNPEFFPQGSAQASFTGGNTNYNSGVQYDTAQYVTTTVITIPDIVPVVGDTYSLYAPASECYDGSGDGTWNTNNCQWYEDSGSVSVSATVTSDPAWPTPPSGATTYANLQGGSWYQVYGPTSGTAAPYGNGNTGSNCSANLYGTESSTTGVLSPSLSGTGSLEIQNNINTCDTEWNVLTVQDLCGGTAPSCSSTPPENYEYQAAFYLASGDTYQALEFDPDLTDSNGNTYEASVECDSGTGDWRYFDTYNTQWKDFTKGSGGSIKCAPLFNNGAWSAGQWYRLRVYATMDTNNQQYAYPGLFLDTYNASNQTWTEGDNLLTGGAEGPISALHNGWPSRISTEEQLDNNISNSSSTEVVYYDDYSLTVW